MMTATLAGEINACLKAAAAVTQIAGSRIYPGTAPQGVTSPFTVITEVSSTAEESHDDANGLDATTVQFSSYATTDLVAMTLRSAIRAALLSPTSGISAKIIQPVTRTLEADEQNLSNAILELTFMHNPTT